MNTKTINLPTDVHMLIKRKQLEFFEKGVDIKIVDIASEAIIAGLDSLYVTDNKKYRTLTEFD